MSSCPVLQSFWKQLSCFLVDLLTCCVSALGYLFLPGLPCISFTAAKMNAKGAAYQGASEQRLGQLSVLPPSSAPCYG